MEKWQCRQNAAIQKKMAANQNRALARVTYNHQDDSRQAWLATEKVILVHEKLVAAKCTS
uniref:Uncharacterized protein n=1 Tax=Marseillevirus LCMAC103 TaxID=2506604 RepID=A0A481YVH0_9VIRU|nr:MAG: hypothetical protein LCMAC103_01170 [Marseillevirus LCMAC103]